MRRIGGRVGRWLAVGSMVALVLPLLLPPRLAAQGTLKVGMILAMTGPGAFYGKVMSRGAQLAVDQINKAGGVGGYKLELLIEDHKSGDADAAVSAARKLMEVDKVPVILTSYSAPTLAIQPIAVEKNVLLLNGGAVGSQLVGKRTLYNTRMLANQSAPFVVQWAVERLNAKRIATLFWNDAAGQGMNGGIKEACKKLGCQIVAEEPHDIGAKSYSPQLARLRASRPDVLTLGSWGDDVGYILNQARAYGLTVPIVGVDWTPNAQKIGGKPMDGYTLSVDRFDPGGTDATTKAFVEAYRAAHGETAELYAANYYEHVRFVLGVLIKRVADRGADPAKPGVLLSEMERAIGQGLKFQSVYGGEMQISPDGTVVKALGVYQVKDGELKLIGRIVAGKIQQ